MSTPMGMLTTQHAAGKESQVSSALERQRLSCELLIERLSELEKRLEPVLCPEQEARDKSTASPPASVPLAKAIDDRGAMVANAADRLQRILNSLEL